MFRLAVEKKVDLLEFKLALPKNFAELTCAFSYEYKTAEGTVVTKVDLPIRERQGTKYYLTHHFPFNPFSFFSPLEITVSVVTPRGVALLGKWTYINNQLNRQREVVPFPERMIGFSLTNQCNLQCVMCWQQDRTTALYLPYEKIKSVIEEVRLLGRPPVYFWGGEPFLHPQFWEIIRMVKANGFFCIVNTNGMALKKEIERILASGLDMIVVSIDGNEFIHDKIRGRQGVYQRVVSGLEQVLAKRKKRPIIAVNSVITEFNYENLDELVELKKKLGFDYLDFQFLIYYTQEEKESYKSRYKRLFATEPFSADDYGADYGNIDLDLLCTVRNRIAAAQDHHIRFFPYAIHSAADVYSYFKRPWKLGITSCDSIDKSFWVEPNGDVVPCSIFPDYVVGNIKEQGFYRIWNNKKFQTFRQAMNEELFSICYRCCDLYKKDYI